jgi:hypothetical protein
MISVNMAWAFANLRRMLDSRLLKRSEEQLAPSCLYHYTDAAGLLGIIKSGTLWATNFRYLNDSSEFIYASGLIKEVVAEATEGALGDSPKARLRDSILRGTDKKEDSEVTEFTEYPQPYIACFSERGDGLSQWRGYGKSIGGYSLGFSFQHIRAVEEAINRTRVQAHLFRCWYDKSAQKQLISEAFEMAVRAVSDGESRGEHFRDADVETLVDTILRPVSRAYKDPAFEDEREWRLVVDVEDASVNKSAVEFRGGQFTLVPYVSVPLTVDGSIGLAEVVVGPTPLPEIARRAAMLCFRNQAPEVKVFTSDIPFRRV